MNAPLLPDDDVEPLHFARQALVHLDDFIERVGDFSGEARPLLRHAHREIASVDSLQNVQERGDVERGGAIGNHGHGSTPATKLRRATAGNAKCARHPNCTGGSR